MKVKLLVGRSGPGGAQSPNDVIDVGNDEGQRMIAAGQAVLVRSAPKPEKAVKQ